MLKRRRHNRLRDESAPRLRLLPLPWRKLGAAALAVLGVAGASAALLLFLNQPIEHIRVDGQFQHLSALEVESAVRAQLHGAGLVTVRLNDVRRSLRLLPWVESATVQRSWPRGIAVQVTEQQAVARWNDTDLVNARGDVFANSAHFVPPELPQLAGPAGSEADVVARYLAVQGRIVEAGLRLAALRLDARGSWELQLDDGVTVRIGRKQVDERFARFLTVVLRMITERAADIAYVDMRYTNGFAVGWRSGAPRLASGAHAR
ncbi:MAG: cell division protein FtsQ/DivIB, partial [Gammaproteobacteria bacterium]|nr:cell division protein FtsQ/DivIB [Gammaproteobacteria bacterium]